MIDDFVLLVVIIHAAQIAAVVAAVAVAARFCWHRPFVVRCLWLVVLIKCLTPPLVSSQASVFSWINGPWMSRSVDTRQGVHGLVLPNGDMETSNANDVFVATSTPPRIDFHSDAGSLGVSTADQEIPATNAFFTGAATEQHDESSGTVERLNRFAPPIPWFTVALLTSSLIGFFVTGIRYVRCARTIRRHRVPSLEERVNGLVQELAGKAQLKHRPRIRVTDVLFGPAVMGVWRPVIVLPRVLLEGLTEDQIRPVIAHELVHIRRGDLWVGMFQAAAQCLWWFWPPVWVANRQLSRSTEHCCDEDAIRVLGCSPSEYARSLLAVIECKHRLKPVPVFPGMKPVEITSQRMERIMSLTQGSRPRMSLWSVMALLLFAGAVLPGATSAQEDPKAVLPDPVTADSPRHTMEEPDTPRPKVGATERGGGASATVSTPSVDVDVIATGDFVNVTIAASGQSNIDAQLLCRISEDGTVAIPDMHNLRVVGLTPLAVASLIAENLRQSRLYRNPTVTVAFLHKNKRPHTLDREIIGDAVDGNAGITGDLVLDNQWVQVLGAVGKSGSYDMPLDQPLTFLLAIEKAGGLLEGADDRVILRRKVASGATTYRVLSLKKASHDESANPALKAGDVLVVERAATANALSSVEQKMTRDLSQQVSLSFTDEPLKEVLRKIATQCGVNLLLDVRTSASGEPLANTDKQIDNVMVTLDVRQVTLRAALETLCRQHGLEFEAVNEVIRIQQAAGLDARYTIRVYNVADLIVPVPTSDDAPGQNLAAETPLSPAPKSTGTNLNADFAPLVELIRTTVEPDSWNEHAGRIAPVQDNLSLVIRQKTKVHEQIIELLNQVRKLHDIQITTSFTVVQFKTPEQLAWLEENVVFQKRPDQSPWALLPLHNATAESTAWSKEGNLMSAPKITTFVGQEATLEISCVPDGQLRMLTAATPLPGEQLLNFSYAAAGGSDLRRRLSDQQVTQIVGNGQTLLLDITETTKPSVPFTSTSPFSKDELLEAEKIAAERQKLADRLRGRIILAVTPTLIRVAEEKEFKPETP